MKRYNSIILLALLGGLFIYVFYRTEKTVVNILLDRLSGHRMHHLIVWVRARLKLPEFMVYSLPEGLWVLAATMISRNLYARLGKTVIRLSWLPAGYAVVLEFLQLLHWMPGRFDLKDILCSLVMAWWATRKAHCPWAEQNIFDRLNYRTWSLCCVYSIVFLSHVSR